MITQTDLELLNAYLDNALLPDERRILESRIVSDPALRAELNSLRATRDLLRSLPTPTAPRSFTLTREQATRESTVVLARRVIPYVAAAAAAVTLTFGILSLDGDGSTTSSEPPQVVSAPTRGADSAAAAAPAEESDDAGLLSAEMAISASATPQPTSAAAFLGTQKAELTLSAPTVSPGAMTGGIPISPTDSAFTSSGGETASSVAQLPAQPDSGATSVDLQMQANGVATDVASLQGVLTDAIMPEPETAIQEEAAPGGAADMPPLDPMLRSASPTATPEMAAAFAMPVPTMTPLSTVALPPDPPSQAGAQRARDRVVALLEAIRALFARLFTGDDP